MTLRAAAEVEPRRLADVMRAFANPVRIEILRQLKRPRTLAEIRVTPHRRGGGRADRAVNATTVRHHLAVLTGIGAVRTRRLLRDGAYHDHFVVDHRQMFALTEELRAMGRIRPQGLDALDGTVPADVPSPPSAPGPCVVLVNGAYEGHRIALAPPTQAWEVGRHPRATICLDYDPHVSLRQALLRRRGSTFEVADVAAARNRTHLNWQPLAPGAAARLASGDIVGAGRSLLLFLDR